LNMNNKLTSTFFVDIADNILKTKNESSNYSRKADFQ